MEPEPDPLPSDQQVHWPGISFDRGPIRYPEIPDNAMPEGLAAAVNECAGERERALLTEGMWADPVPVPCINCGGPLVRVERRGVCPDDESPLTVSYMEAYYRLGAMPGTDIRYHPHTDQRCRRERIGRNAYRAPT